MVDTSVKSEESSQAMRRRLVSRLEAALPGTPVRAMIVGAATIALASAWFNEGFFSYDEHFQILEFAWFKLGRTPAAGLAWEFGARMRPALQPWLAAGLFKGLEAIGLFTPLAAAFVLRLASGLIGLWVSLELCVRTLPSVQDARLKRLLLAGMLFLWFLPYAHGRFASENWGGLLFFGGLCLITDAVDPAVRRPLLRAALGGLLWSAAFFCRFQVGLAIAGAGVWLLAVARARVGVVGALAASFVAACAVNVVLDRWLYSEWVCTPCNYFYVNVMLGKAAAFGVMPWWFYLAQLLALLVPPFSLLLVALLAASVWSCRRHVLVWAVVPFVVGHTVLGHKETRFLISMTYALVPLIVLGADRLPAEWLDRLRVWQRQRAGVISMRVFLGLNLLALAVMTVKPSHETAVVYRRLYEASLAGPVVLFSRTRLPYALGEMEVDFYRPDNLMLKPLRSAGEVSASMAATPGRVFFFEDSLRVPGWMADGRIACTPVARTLPVWAPRYNVNNWTGRLSRWSVFALSPAAGTGGC